jgi:hypothetical protein
MVARRKQEDCQDQERNAEMTLFKQDAPFVVTEKEFKTAFREQVLLTSDFRKGRQKPSLLGSDRKQISLDVGEAIIAALIDDYDKRNGKLDKSLNLYHQKGRRGWASQKLSSMAHFKAAATGGNPVECLWNATSDLIITGRSTKGLNIYARADIATKVEMLAYHSIIRRRIIVADANASRALIILKAGAEALGTRTLEQAYAEECERYHIETGA